MNRTQRTLAGLLAAVTAAGVTTYDVSGGSKATAAGAPIRLMVDGTQTPAAALGGISFPYGATGAQAAAAAINAAGGIGGHKVVIDVCDNKGDPNVSSHCGRSAKSNGDIAVVGSFDLGGGAQIVSTLQAENLPFIGGLPGLPVQFSSPISFQFDPGPLLSNFAGLWSTEKCTSVVAMVPANPGNNQVLAEQVAGGKKLGMSVDGVLVPIGLADVSAMLSAALATKPNCITLEGDGPTTVKFILQGKKFGYKGKFITSVASLAPQLLKVLGPQGDGIAALNSTLLPSSNDSMVKQFEKDLTTYFKGNASQVSSNSNEFGQDGWSSVQLVKQALSKSKSFTSAYLLKKIPTMCNVNVGNVYPHIDFCKSIGSKRLSRVYNDYWQYYSAKGGQYVSTDKVWHNLSATIPGK